MHTDIRQDAWIIEKSPLRLRPYLFLMRVDRPVAIVLLLLPSLWGLLLETPWQKVPPHLWLIFILGAFVMRSAGCIINDLTDETFDGRVARTKTRPLPSHQITRRQAFYALGILVSVALALLLTLPPLCWGLGFVGFALVIAYPWMKRITFWPQFFLSLVYNWGLLMGAVAVKGQISRAAFLLYVVAGIWTFIYDTLYAHQDKEDDAHLGLGSSARALGERTKQVLTLLSMGMLLISLYVGVLSQQGVIYFCAASMGALLCARVILRADLEKPETCLIAFKEAQVYGWLILVGLVAPSL